MNSIAEAIHQFKMNLAKMGCSRDIEIGLHKRDFLMLATELSHAFEYAPCIETSVIEISTSGGRILIKVKEEK